MKIAITLATTILNLAVGTSNANLLGIRGLSTASCEVDATTGDDTCGKKKFCQLPTGECKKKSAIHTGGTCEVPPTMCGYNWDPVCGCDLQTYANACEAASNAVSVMFEGVCESQIGEACTTPTDSCTGGLFCELPDGECNKKIAEFSGTCQENPQMCTSDNNPVCGCDGKTYANKCNALAVGVSVSRNGECNSSPNRATGDRCEVGKKASEHCTAAGEYCKIEEGGCIYNAKDAQGRCELKPEICTANIDEVCGCDYNTYANECEAAAAGVSIRRRGPCSRFEQALIF